MFTTPSSAPPADSARPVVVDTDGAIDDLVALTLLLESDAVEVRAITVSGTGEVRCPAGTAVVQELLTRTGDDGVPVACGRATPLVGTREFPREWRDAADSGWGVVTPAGTPIADSQHAVDLLVAMLQPGVTLLTLGPLTNIAEAFRADVELARRVDSIVIMGGAVDVAGNVTTPNGDTTPSEWNAYVDPTALSEVFGAGAPVTLVALDATNQAPVTPLFLERLALNSNTVAASLVADLYEANPLVGAGGAYFWDPLAAAAVIDPSLLATELTHLEVVTDEGPHIGRTVRRGAGHPIDLATGADTGRFEDLLLRTLEGVPADIALVEPAPPVGEAVITYDGTNCAYDGPTTVAAGRVGFTFESVDPAWAAAIGQLTGESTLEAVVAWIAAHPDSQEAPPGVGGVTFVAAGTSTYVEVVGPSVGVVCTLNEPGPLLIATTLTVE